MSKQLYMYELGVVPEDEGKSGMDVVAANASDACLYAEAMDYKVVSLNEVQSVEAIVEDKS